MVDFSEDEFATEAAIAVVAKKRRLASSASAKSGGDKGGDNGQHCYLCEAKPGAKRLQGLVFCSDCFNGVRSYRRIAMATSEEDLEQADLLMHEAPCTWRQDVMPLVRSDAVDRRSSARLQIAKKLSTKSKFDREETVQDHIFFRALRTRPQCRDCDDPPVPPSSSILPELQATKPGLALADVARPVVGGNTRPAVRRRSGLPWAARLGRDTTGHSSRDTSRDTPGHQPG
jgi:hypothetical protein